MSGWCDSPLWTADRQWVREAHGEHVLLHGVDYHCGLVEADLDVIRTWLGQRTAE
jgi:hypothetical protein